MGKDGHVPHLNNFVIIVVLSRYGATSGEVAAMKMIMK